MHQHTFTTRFLDQEIPVLYVKERGWAAEVLSRLMGWEGLIGLDTETEALPTYKHISTAALSPHLAKIRLLQVFNGRTVVVFDLKFIDYPEMFIPFLESKRFIAHNAVFDMMFLYKMGVKHIDCGCTYQLGKLMVHASRPDDGGIKLSLEGMMKGLFKADIIKEVQTSDWSVPDLNFEQIEYSALDAICVLKLAEKLAPVITGYKMERYYKLIRAAQHPIVHMQLNGLGIDVEGHRRLCDEWLGKLNTARKAVVKVLGVETISPHTVAAFLESRLDSQTLALWPRTDAGKLQTDCHAFADFADVSPIISPFAEYQKLKTLTSDFGSKLLQQINPATGRIHANYRLNGARTGRLSCTQPNLQQLPRDNGVRANFISGSNSRFVVADYSQIELRVAAELSQDATMLDAYRRGIDLHTLTASKVSGKRLADVTKTDRQLAKAINFGFLFGLGAKKFKHYAKKSYGAEVTDEEASSAIKTFRQTYSGYHAWQWGQAERACETLSARTPCGKLRRLDPENTYGTAMNTPVQGGAAECMLHALVRLQQYADKGIYRIVNCVHDEVVLETGDSTLEVREASECLEEAFEYGFLKVFPKGVNKNLCEVGVGGSWAEAKH